LTFYSGTLFISVFGTLYFSVYTSPYHHISTETTVPFLLMHGEADRIVPPEHSIEFDEKLKSLGIRSELHVYEGYLHADMRLMADENMERVRKFLDEVLNVKRL
jgi:dipeptidyl aminopeptidase/acylaminoacyl peptidase